jgi:hypothetical protein
VPPPLPCTSAREEAPAAAPAVVFADGDARTLLSARAATRDDDRSMALSWGGD